MATNAPNSTMYDPYADADAAKPSNRHYFGFIVIDAYPVVLVKGQRRVLFDSLQHSEDRRVTAIDMTLTPLSRPGQDTFSIKKEPIAQSNEWARITKPSLDKLGLGTKDVNNRYVQVEAVPIGSYVNQKTGETKTATTFRFIAVYSDQAACQAACDEFYRSRTAAQPAATPAPASPANGTTPAAADSVERATLAKFLPSYWAKAKAAGPDSVHELEKLLASNPTLAKHFDLTSPEVQQIILGG